MKVARLILLSIMIATAVQAGTITGTVRAQGKMDEAGGGGGGKYDSRKFKFVEKVDYESLEDFVVYIDQKPASTPAPPTKPLRVITQKDAVFRPHVLPILAGTTIEWPNFDDIYHNVFSMSDSNPFDLDLYKHPTVKSWTYKNPGRVDVFCSIHSKMSCVILVLENPWFSPTDKHGKFKIENVPAGVYKLKAWHERVPSETKEITVLETGEVKVDFSLGIKNLPRNQE